MKYFLLAIAGCILLILTCHWLVSHHANGKLYKNAATVPVQKVGLLLGTSKFLRNGKLNPYYHYRVEAAAELIRAGKIKYLVISGDNTTANYNEPESMKADLIAMGIDSTILYLDYAGLRTLDSIVRLQKIFGQDSVTIISQAFHNERAVYLASRYGIAAIGYNARDVGNKVGFNVQVRERFARVKMFLDLLFGKDPKHLGEKVTLPRE